LARETLAFCCLIVLFNAVSFPLSPPLKNYRILVTNLQKCLFSLFIVLLQKKRKKIFLNNFTNLFLLGKMRKIMLFGVVFWRGQI